MADIYDPLVWATIALVLATGVLASFTGLLWQTNRRLADTETRRADLDERREKTESRRQRYRRLGWKVEIAQRIQAAPESEFLPKVEKAAAQGIYRGRPGWTTEPARWLRHFARLLDPEDGVTVSSFILNFYDALDMGSSRDEDNMAPFFEGLRKLRDGLYNRPKGKSENLLMLWRAQMDALAAGEEVPPSLELGQ